MVVIFNFLLKRLFGYSTLSGKVCDKQKSFCEIECSAHRLKVVLRAAPVYPLGVYLDQFLLSHVSYEDPRECITKHKNVTLMNIDSKYALFAVVDDNLDVYDSRHGTFIYR